MEKNHSSAQPISFSLIFLCLKSLPKLAEKAKIRANRGVDPRGRAGAEVVQGPVVSYVLKVYFTVCFTKPVVFHCFLVSMFFSFLFGV